MGVTQAESNNTCYRKFAYGELVTPGLWKTDEEPQFTTGSRPCPCGKPAAFSGRRRICAVCRRAQRYAREIEARIERTYLIARRQQRAQRRTA